MSVLRTLALFEKLCDPRHDAMRCSDLRSAPALTVITLAQRSDTNYGPKQFMHILEQSRIDNTWL
jgi:hypothetical protein